MVTLLKKAARRATDRWHGRAVLAGLSAEDRQLIARVHDRRLTYLPPSRLASIVAICRRLDDLGVEGSFLEAGCALGGSTIVIASAKRVERPLVVYDVFGMIPPPDGDDTPDVHDRYRTILNGESKGIGGDEYYGYQSRLFQTVCDNLASFGIDRVERSTTLVEGLVQDTLDIDGPVAFAHIDVDWYDPVLTCLTRIVPHLGPGGAIVLDDYHAWGGCRKATDEFLASSSVRFDTDDSTGALILTRA